MIVVLTLLVIGAALVVIGAVVKSLLWLSIVGLVICGATGIYHALRRRSRILRR